MILPMIALPKLTLENIAQQLQARCDPVFMGQELAALIAAAPEAIDPEHAADMELEIRSYCNCRGPVHGDQKKVCECRYCRITGRRKI